MEMSEEQGASVPDQALVNEAAAHLHPSGFDPSRIPEYPFFHATAPERAFGCERSRYLNVNKDGAREISNILPEESRMADMLFFQGHLGDQQYGMARRSYGVDASPEQVRDTTGALLRSFGVSHEVKIATVAVALHRWFPRDSDGSPKGGDGEAAPSRSDDSPVLQDAPIVVGQPVDREGDNG
jgi:hypothetical protein